MKRNLVRWIPAVLAPVLVAATAVGFSVSATAAVDLPDKSASQILQLINTNPDIAFSGRVVKKAALGLPPMNIVPDISQASIDQMAKSMPKEMMDFLPQASAQGELALALEFFAGVHTANIYVDGADKARLQVLDLISERNFIRNGSDLWFYDASKALVKHSVIDPAQEEQAKKDALGLFNTNSAKLPFDATSPAAVADYFLNEAGKDTVFTVGKDAKIAARGVYQITGAPRNAGSLVASVTISVDAATGLPLAVVVKAVGEGTPAFEVAFESINFAKPDASNFNFVVPAGSKVEEVPVPTRDAIEKLAAGKAPTAADKARAQAEAEKLIAQGWSAVVEVPTDMVPAQITQLKDNALFAELTKPVAGGRIFSTTLMNVFIADDGRIFAGSVTQQRLLEAAKK
jgi:outer membrane lipoprotein-sorting protein